MENMKFMLANKNLMKEKLDNWKCDKCGSMNDPKIITKKVDDKPLEIHRSLLVCFINITAVKENQAVQQRYIPTRVRQYMKNTNMRRIPQILRSINAVSVMVQKNTLLLMSL